MKVFTGLSLLTPALGVIGDYGLFRNNEGAVTYNLLELNDIKWTIDVQSVFELDTGYEFISI